MGLHHRKLIPEICQLICYVKESCSSDCETCIKICLSNPQFQYPYYPPSSPAPPLSQEPPFYSDSDVKHHKISTYLILALCLLATAFLVLCSRAIYARFFSRRRRVLSSRQQQTEETHDDFLDEEHGPMVDHPIWYIRTPGLQQSVISAITVCKYKKGEGLIEGRDCSVCLSEFQEDENLRLLPKCHHAFHLPCIDTWLRSHTNCPNCRAPIVTNPNAAIVDPSSSSLENSNTQMEIVEGNGESNEGLMENSASELRNRAEEEGELEVEDGARVCETETPETEVVSNIQVQPRRSVSLDFSSAAKINLALATVQSMREVNELIISKRVGRNENLASCSRGSSFRTRYVQNVPSSMKRSRSYNGIHLLSWYNRNQR